ncbi:MAG: chorismate mutase [Actinomycetota bacterium]
MTTRAARGAIVVPGDEREHVLGQSARLVGELLARNDVASDDVVSIFFTASPDLVSAFPAEGARELGLTGVPLLCAQEIAVPGSMPRVIRILMHFATDRAQSEVQHVYLDGAELLRDDLT